MVFGDYSLGIQPVGLAGKDGNSLSMIGYLFAQGTRWLGMGLDYFCYETRG